MAATATTVAFNCTACRESARRAHAQPAVQPTTLQKGTANRPSARPCAGGGYLGTNVSAPIGFGVFHIKTAWLGRRGRRFVNVYAGAFRKKPERGWVALMEVPVTNGPIVGPSGWYAPPVKRDGPLAISCVRGDTVYLSSRHFRYVFDLRKPRVRPLHRSDSLG